MTIEEIKSDLKSIKSFKEDSYYLYEVASKALNELITVKNKIIELENTLYNIKIRNAHKNHM